MADDEAGRISINDILSTISTIMGALPDDDKIQTCTITLNKQQVLVLGRAFAALTEKMVYSTIEEDDACPVVLN